MNRWERSADRTFLRQVEATLDEAKRLAGDQLICAKGCSGCCHGPFPITELDRRRLHEGLRELLHRSPARAAALVTRARAAIGSFSVDFPGDLADGALGGDEAAEEEFFDRHSDAPCPALDPATQACELYSARPITCRTYGPPVRLGAEALPPCVLCFTASADTAVECCRVTIDPDGLEGAILSSMDDRLGDRYTIIACALAEAFPGQDPVRDPGPSGPAARRKD